MRTSNNKKARQTWQSVMSQDAVSTAKIIVDSISSTPVSAFHSPSSGHAEAIVLASFGGHTRRPCHVARDLSTPAGFSLTPILEREVSEIAAGVAYPSDSDARAHGFFLHEGGLSSASHDGARWSDAQAIVLPLGVSCSNLRVAYSPTGRLVLYGQTATGDLLLATQHRKDGPFAATVQTLDGALTGGDFFLCMNDEAEWVLAANISGVPWIFSGEVEKDRYTNKQQVTAFKKTLKQVVLGYFNPTQNTVMFLLVDGDDAIHVCSASGDDDHTIKSIPYGKLAHATGHVSQDDGLLHVYGVDTEERLWVLHQSQNNPWHEDGTPNWAPLIPLGKGVTGVFGDINPAQAPTLFALDGDRALRLHQQDVKTSMWKSGHVHQAAEQAFEVVRFRTEIALVDASGLPLANTQVTVAPTAECSATDISVGGKLYNATHDAPAQLTTDANGKLWIAVATNAGMACPSMLVTAEGLVEPFTITPAAPVQTYLGGKGTLNPTNPGGPLPVFDADGNTLANATVNNGQPLAAGARNNKQLAGVAAAAIQNTARLGTDDAQATHGFSGSFEPQRTFFKHVNSADEAKKLLQEGRTQLVGGFWDDVRNFFGDIWEGIKNGLIAIQDFFVSVAEKIAHFTLQICEWIKTGVELIIHGVEQVAHFIAGVFHAIEAAIERVIDWLKALFDFGAIWRTKMAFQDILLKLPDSLLVSIKGAENAGDKWFAKQKQEVDQYFDELKKRYEGKSLADQQRFQHPADGPSSKPIAGGASPADFTSNVHHNWLMEKVSTHVDDKHVAKLFAAQDDPFEGFKKHLADSGKEVSAAFSDMGEAFRVLFSDPANFATLGVPKLIDAAKELTEAVLDFLDAIFDLVLQTAALAMSELKNVLSQEIPLGFINTLWGWMAKLAGYPEDSKLTLAAFISLVGAFPTTLIFKLIAGVHLEPFPNGKMPAPIARATALGSIEMPWQCHVTADVLQILQFIPAFSADFMGNLAPMWISGISIGFSLVIWVLNNGYPDALQMTGGIVALAEALVVFQVVAASTFLWKRRSDVINVLMSVYGLGRLAFGAYQISQSKDTDPLGNKMALVLLPLPPLFAFLNFDEIRASEAAPFAIGGNFFFDFVGYVGGGSVKLYESVQSIPSQA